VRERYERREGVEIDVDNPRELGVRIRSLWLPRAVRPALEILRDDVVGRKEARL